MTLFTGTIAYILIWWTVIFMVLPWGLVRDEHGRPNTPHLQKKVLITTVISAFIWMGVYLLIEADMISFREMAEVMARSP